VCRNHRGELAVKVPSAGIYSLFSITVSQLSSVGALHAINVRATVRAPIGAFMKHSNLTFIAAALCALLDSESPVVAQATETAAASEVEEIYIARSVRESQMRPTEFCAKARTGVGNATVEAQFAFRSVATRTSDGRVVDANVKTIGSVHLCTGPTANNPAILDFYGEIVLGSTAFKGFGECHGKSDFPEKGVVAARCYLDLSGLPAEYVGGQLTTNTLNSPKKLIGTETDPVGYTQSSIATIRLWKKRDGR
jgi:hypothetical protein